MTKNNKIAALARRATAVAAAGVLALGCLLYTSDAADE